MYFTFIHSWSTVGAFKISFFKWSFIWHIWHVCNVVLNLLIRRCCSPQSQVLCALWKLFLIRTQKVPLLLNLMDDLLAGMWNCPSPRFGSRKCYSSRGWGERHAVIEVFTTRRECDGTENVGDSDAWLNRLLCTECRVALWVAMPPFIVLKLKGSLIRELHYCTACSFSDIEARRTKTMSAKSDDSQQARW